VLEASVEMGLDAELAELVQVAVIHVSVDAEETLVDGAEGAHELLGGSGTIGEGLGEDASVVQDVLDPCHEQIDVLGSRDGSGLRVLWATLPQILVRSTGSHRGAGGSGAEVAHGAVEQIHLIEKVDGVCAEPLADVLTRRKLYRKLQVSSVESGIGTPTHFKGTRCSTLPRLECLRL